MISTINKNIYLDIHDTQYILICILILLLLVAMIKRRVSLVIHDIPHCAKNLGAEQLAKQAQAGTSMPSLFQKSKLDVISCHVIRIVLVIQISIMAITELSKSLFTWARGSPSLNKFLQQVRSG